MEMNDIETRYQGEYEKHIDPFKNFNAQERQRKYSQLKPYDKAALQLVSEKDLYFYNGHNINW